MKKYILLPVLLSLCCISNLYAETTKNSGIDFRADWKADKLYETDWKCQTTLGKAFGTPDGKHEEWNKDFGSADKINKTLKNVLNYGKNMYIAREIHANGALFCKTIIAAKRTNYYADSHTVYYEGNGDCFWLCKEGYTGKGCTKVNTSNVCQDKGFFEDRRAKYGTSLSKISVTDNIEDKIPMFYPNEYKNCSSKGREYLCSETDQEHDIILGLYLIGNEDTDDRSKGMRFTVMPLVVRAGGAWRSLGHEAEHYAWPMLYWPAGGKYDTFLCPEGWKFSGSQCVPDDNNEACKMNNLCENFSRDGFDPKKYKIHSRDGEVCAEYRCIVGAFASKTDHTCVPCPATDADIPSLYYVDEDGLCQKCEVGQWPVDGKCKTATSLSHNKLQYGQEGVPATVSDDECWTMTTPDTYKACVVGGGNTNSNQALIDLLKGKTFFNKYSNVSGIAVPSQVSEMKAVSMSTGTK